MKKFIPFLLIGLAACAPPIPDDQRKLAAENIAKSMKAIYTENPTIVEVSLSNFDLLDHGFYEETTKNLELLGFRRAGEIENQTISINNPSAKTCLRLFVSEDGRTSGAIYHLRKSYQLADGLKMVELETEFTDGHFINTNNNPKKNHISTPPEFHSTSYPNEPVGDLIKKHRDDVAAYMQKNPSAQPRLVRFYEDVLAQQQRLAVLQARHRKNIRGVTYEELKGLAPEFPRRELKKLVVDVNEAFERL